MSQPMEDKLSLILSMVQSVLLRQSALRAKQVQTIRHCKDICLVEMIHNIVALVEEKVQKIGGREITLLEQQLQQQESQNRSLVKKELLLHEKVRLVQEELIDAEQMTLLTKQDNLLLKSKILELEMELNKSLKSYSLQLGERQLLITKLESDLNIMGVERSEKVLKRQTRHVRGKSDDIYGGKREREKERIRGGR